MCFEIRGPAAQIANTMEYKHDMANGSIGSVRLLLVLSCQIFTRRGQNKLGPPVGADLRILVRGRIILKIDDILVVCASDL